MQSDHPLYRKYLESEVRQLADPASDLSKVSTSTLETVLSIYYGDFNKICSEAATISANFLKAISDSIESIGRSS